MEKPSGASWVSFGCPKTKKTCRLQGSNHWPFTRRMTALPPKSEPSSHLFISHFFNICSCKPASFLFILLHINMELRKEGYDRWTKEKVQALWNISCVQKWRVKTAVAFFHMSVDFSNLYRPSHSSRNEDSNMLKKPLLEQYILGLKVLDTATVFTLFWSNLQI